MSDNEDGKRHLASSDSVGKFLNMQEPEEADAPENLPVADLPMADTPVVDLPVSVTPVVEDEIDEDLINQNASKVDRKIDNTVIKKKPEVKTVRELFNSEKSDLLDSNIPTDQIHPHKLSTADFLEEEHKKITSPFLRVFKAVLPYVAIFLIGLGLYFFYFSDFSINSLFKSNNLTIENVANTSNADLEKLKSDQETAYLTWMKQFFFEVNDDAIISMDTDVSGNGLTNFEKYLLNLNPKVFSSRGSNTADGQLVIDDISPWTGKPFTDAQKELVNKYINKELISNRITAAALTRGVTKFAQYVNTDSPYYVDPKTLASTNPNSQPSEVESNQTAYNASQQASNNPNPNNQSPSQNPSQAVSINSSTDINLAIPGKLEIPENNISVPLIWTTAVKNFDADLKKGVVHYPGTALPGQTGTSYISGHSSGYVWDKSPYKTIFAGLGGVKDGTSFTITATQKSGKIVIYHYVVSNRGEYAANDQAQFVNTADSVVALSTCWPVGTTARRLVLFGKLSQTEQL